ncbi:unnamed protein product, partial [Amoebophrya sp. A25]|eukprot:GSA25T00001698001.1
MSSRPLIVPDDDTPAGVDEEVQLVEEGGILDADESSTLLGSQHPTTSGDADPPNDEEDGAEGETAQSLHHNMEHLQGQAFQGISLSREISKEYTLEGEEHTFEGDQHENVDSFSNFIRGQGARARGGEGEAIVVGGPREEGEARRPRQRSERTATSSKRGTSTRTMKDHSKAASSSSSPGKSSSSAGKSSSSKSSSSRSKASSSSPRTGSDASETEEAEQGAFDEQGVAAFDEQGAALHQNEHPARFARVPQPEGESPSLQPEGEVIVPPIAEGEAFGRQPVAEGELGIFQSMLNQSQGRRTWGRSSSKKKEEPPPKKSDKKKQSKSSKKDDKKSKKEKHSSRHDKKSKKKRVSSSEQSSEGGGSVWRGDSFAEEEEPPRRQPSQRGYPSEGGARGAPIVVRHTTSVEEEVVQPKKKSATDSVGEWASKNEKEEKDASGGPGGPVLPLNLAMDERDPFRDPCIIVIGTGQVYEDVVEYPEDRGGYY